jgi:hypothetical protein
VVDVVLGVVVLVVVVLGVVVVVVLGVVVDVVVVLGVVVVVLEGIVVVVLPAQCATCGLDHLPPQQLLVAECPALRLGDAVVAPSAVVVRPRVNPTRAITKPMATPRILRIFTLPPAACGFLHHRSTGGHALGELAMIPRNERFTCIPCGEPDCCEMDLVLESTPVLPRPSGSQSKWLSCRPSTSRPVRPYADTSASRHCASYGPTFTG